MTERVNIIHSWLFARNHAHHMFRLRGIKKIFFVMTDDKSLGTEICFCLSLHLSVSFHGI